MQRIRRIAKSEHKRHAPVFLALADETRLAIVEKLSHGPPCSIVQLTKGTKLTRQAVTKHLRVLENAGVVHSVKTGRENLFQFNPKATDELRDYLNRVSKQWDEILFKLKSFVEE